MSDQSTKNHHFVPRFLTKPWEDGKRNLRLYSFDSSSVAVESSETALTGADYPKELETFLTKYIEAPLGELRAQVQNGQDSTEDPKIYRAAILLTALQRARNRAVSEKKWLDELLKLLKTPTDAIDGLQAEQGHGLLCAQTPGGSRPLWFPSSGSFPLLDKTLAWKGKRFVPVAVPLDPQRALILYPVGADADLATRNGIRGVVVSSAPQLLGDASAGMDTATRVVVPPGLKESDADLATLLQQARKKNKAAIADHNQAVSPSSSRSDQD